MDYKKIYDNLIIRAQNRVTNGQIYYELHHIIPRCMNGSDDWSNLVYLLPEEHYLAHQLLVKIYPEIFELAFAANMMCTNRPSNKLYGWIRRRISDNMKRNNPNAVGKSRREYIQKNGPVEVDRSYITDEYRKKCSEGKIGSKNPMHGKLPWEHSRATNETKKEWAKADEYYNWWKETKKSYHAMAINFGFDKPMMTHHNMINKFREGWVPNEDNNWKDFKCKI